MKKSLLLAALGIVLTSCETSIHFVKGDTVMVRNFVQKIGYYEIIGDTNRNRYAAWDLKLGYFAFIARHTCKPIHRKKYIIKTK